MDLPIQRVPPMVGPQPPARIPRLGDRERNPKDQELDDEDQESADDRENGGAPASGEPEAPPEDQEKPDPPPEPGEAGSTLDLTA